MQNSRQFEQMRKRDGVSNDLPAIPGFLQETVEQTCRGVGPQMIEAFTEAYIAPRERKFLCMHSRQEAFYVILLGSRFFFSLKKVLVINLSVIFGWLPSRCFWCAALALAVVSGVCFFFGLGAGCIGVGNMAPTKFAVVSIIAFPAVVASTFGGVI